MEPLQPPLSIGLGGVIWLIRGGVLFFAIKDTIRCFAVAPGATERVASRAAGWWVGFAFTMGWLF